MKKILCLMVSFIFLGLSIPAFAADDNIKGAVKLTRAERRAKKAEIKALKKKYKKISKNMAIIYALESIKTSPAKTVYRRIMGINQTQKPLKIEFKNLADINKIYTNSEAVGKMKWGRGHVYINDKHKKAPAEILAVSIAGMSVHTDKKNSVNEETYAWATEAVLWEYFSKLNPEIKNYESTLTEREEALKELYLKSPRDAKYIVNTVRKNNAHIKYQWESRGFTHREYKEKMAKLLEVHNDIQMMKNPAPEAEPVMEDNIEAVTNTVKQGDKEAANKNDAQSAPVLENANDADNTEKPEIDLKLYDVLRPDAPAAEGTSF